MTILKKFQHPARAVLESIFALAVIVGLVAGNAAAQSASLPAGVQNSVDDATPIGGHGFRIIQVDGTISGPAEALDVGIAAAEAVHPRDALADLQTRLGVAIEAIHARSRAMREVPGVVEGIANNEPRFVRRAATQQLAWERVIR